MGLRGKLFIFMSFLFLFFSLNMWFYSQNLFKEINDKWASRYIQKQILYDKSRALKPIMNEVKLLKELSEDPSIVAMALNEEDKTIKQAGIERLEKYRLRAYSHNYFAAFDKSRNYYFNDATQRFSDDQPREHLVPTNPDHVWFFKALGDSKPFNVNVDFNNNSSVVNVWINYVLKHEGKNIGVIGTGFDIKDFTRDSISTGQKEVINFFVDQDGIVRLGDNFIFHENLDLSNKSTKSRDIKLFFTKANDALKIKSIMSELINFPNETKMLWVEHEMSKKLLGITYIEEIGWFNFILIDEKELELVKDFKIFPFLSMLFLLSIVFVSLTLNYLLLSPIDKLKKSMLAVQKGDYNISLRPIGTSEIMELSRQFIAMIDYIKAHKVSLEDKIKERTIGLMQSESKLNSILDTVDAYIYIKDLNGKYIYANQKTCEIFGKTKEELMGLGDELFFEDASAKSIVYFDQTAIADGKKCTSQNNVVKLINGREYIFLTAKIPLTDENGKVYALCGISTDITELKKSEEAIRELAFRDYLTHLPNRRMFAEYFAFMLAQSKRNRKHGALMVIDLDNFKSLNDAFGHNIGDMLLIEVAQRLILSVRAVDMVVRFGGDEFIVVLGDLSSVEESAKIEAVNVATKILEKISQPYKISFGENKEKKIVHNSTASIGVTLFGHEIQNQEKLFEEADRAMYMAKKQGGNQIVLYRNENL